MLCPWRRAPRPSWEASGVLLTRGMQGLLIFPWLSGAFVPADLQSVAGYLGLAVVFARPGEDLIAIFWGFFANVGGVFVLAEGGGGGWALSYHSMEFRHFPNISYFSKS